MAITDVNTMDYGLIQGIFQGFDWGNSLLIIAVVALSAVAITRDTRNIRLLLFPLVFGWSRAGLEIPAYLFAGSAIITVVTLVGVHNIGATLGGIQQAITTAYRGSEAGLRRARERAYTTAQQDMTTSDYLEPITSLQSLKGAERSDWLDKMTQPLQLRKALRSAALNEQVDAKTQKFQIAKALRRVQRGEYVDLKTVPLRYKQQIRSAQLADKIDKATQKEKVNIAIRAIRRGEHVDITTLPIRVRNAIRSATKADIIDQKTQGLQIKKAIRAIKRGDRIDIETLPIQVRRAVRRQLTGYRIGAAKRSAFTPKFMARQQKAMNKYERQIEEYGQGRRDSAARSREMRKGITTSPSPSGFRKNRSPYWEENFFEINNRRTQTRNKQAYNKAFKKVALQDMLNKRR